MRRLWLFAVICMSIGAGVGLLGCHSSEEIRLPPSDTLPLLLLWNITLEKTGVENSTAVLDWLNIRISSDGIVEHIILEFYGIKDGKLKFYHVQADSEKLIFRSSEAEKSTDSAWNPSREDFPGT